MMKLAVRIAALLTCLPLSVFADTVTVFAAASLKEALDANAKAFEAKTGHKIVVSYAGSNALAKQIENGAPADLFISADRDWADYVEQKKLIEPGSRRNLLGNELVLIAPASSRTMAKLAPGVNLGGALGEGRLAMANPDAVPAGKYAREALVNLGAWAPVANKIAPSDNVRAALALVARGEAPLGIVYRTDAIAEKKVRIVDTFPHETYQRIVYPILTLRRSTTAAASTFAGYLSSPEARAVFREFGFLAP